ncbi:hypothetical protein [Streptomyces sp. NPDC057257]|uniref:hypothetical protein n=1 Tax=Streptomyces sp. NPDC057257 TaxID=3346071 RepID=UPI003636CBE1
MRSRRSLVGACLAVVIAAAAGCSTPAAPGPGAALNGPTDTGPLPRALTPAEDASLLYAEDLIVHACMARSGLRFVAEPLAASSRPAAEQRYGTADVTAARAHGYGYSETPARQRRADSTSPDPNEVYQRTLSPGAQRAYETALYGTPGSRPQVELPDGQGLVIATEGCVAEARKRLYGDDLRGYLISQHVTANLEGHIAQDVRNAKAYRSALGGWRTCMANRGFTFATPQDARQGGETAAHKGGLAAEIRVAAADAECGRDHRLLATAVALEQDRFADTGPELTGWIKEFRSLRLAALPKARDLIRAESGSRGVKG